MLSFDNPKDFNATLSNASRNMIYKMTLMKKEANINNSIDLLFIKKSF